MTTFVIVAVDDFRLEMESDDPNAPRALEAIATITQERLNTIRPKIEQALTDAIIFGQGTFEV